MRKYFGPIYLFTLLGFVSCRIQKTADLNKTTWIRGSADCHTNAEPPIQVVRYNSDTWILRENKCVDYEGPFMFFFIGNKKAILFDTGATTDEEKFPLYKTVNDIVDKWQQTNHMQLELIVAHTHSHRDHIAADIQFKDKPHITLVGLKLADIQTYFNLQRWPEQRNTIDLGSRKLEIIPIPGHHETSIAVYDYETKILLTGDSFYPGRLYIKDWPAFKSSTQRLVDFTSTHKISMILGNHIEMTNAPGKDYPIGTTYQPDEHTWPLKVRNLEELNQALIRLGDKPAREVHDDFIIYPVN